MIEALRVRRNITKYKHYLVQANIDPPRAFALGNPTILIN